MAGLSFQWPLGPVVPPVALGPCDVFGARIGLLVALVDWRNKVGSNYTQPWLLCNLWNAS